MKIRVEKLGTRYKGARCFFRVGKRGGDKFGYCMRRAVRVAWYCLEGKVVGHDFLCQEHLAATKSRMVVDRSGTALIDNA